MPSNLSTHPEFQAPLIYSQFAKARIWEEAWVIQQAELPDAQAIDTYLADTQEVAFEVFFGSSFFGLRCRGTPEHVRSVALACVHAQRSSESAASFLTHLSEALQVKAWCEKVEFAEVGAINFWKSVGSYRAPGLAPAKADPKAFLDALLKTPLGRNTLHPKALELGCTGLFPHWFGLLVSSDQAPFALSANRLREVLALA